MEKSELELSNFEIDAAKKSEINKTEVPNNWPALHTMVMDEKNRLWVATITDSDSTFNWRVVDEKGAPLASFSYPGNRKRSSVWSEPLYKIKNGYFYELERDMRSGIDRIVKYKIEFTER